jgi:REP element-mobilizing transposase RayT
MSYNDLRKGRHSAAGQEYFITSVVAGRRKVFCDFACARLMVSCLRDIQREGRGEWLAWVVMPDHFHGLLRLRAGPLPELMRQLCGRSARMINMRMGNSGRVWQPGYYDRALRDEDDRVSIARYIVANPLRSGIVHKLGDYPHWDSVWL